MLDFLFGSVEDNAEREYANYKPGKGRKKDLGDHIGDFLTGRGAAIDRAVEEEHVNRLKKAYGTTIGELNAQPNVNIGPLTKDTDSTILEQQIAVAKPKAQAFKEMKLDAARNNVIIDPTKITDAATGYAFINSEVKAEKERERLKLKAEAEDKIRRDRIYQEGLTRRQNERLDRKEAAQERRLDRIDARDRLDRLEERKMNMELRGDEMKFKYAQLAQQDRMARQDKKDRAMMALIQGLGNLGAAFTV